MFSIFRCLPACLTRSLCRNVRLALELANTVADARYSLAEEFFGNRAQKNRLSDYLSAVRSAAIEGMTLGGTADPFKLVIG